ncbi:MAG TPA: SMC family ATPase [Acidimicrobiia bacterium]
MRPVRIRVEGFSAYRDPVDVDFTDVDFFSLSGPTGSGKSSLIDAMVFALFGRVPRLGGNAVAPAITAGADRARVRFEFEVGDNAYTAVRMAERTSSGGATVKEARLEEGDHVVAGGADDVTRAVEDVLKLRYDDFTRTVVLPQGDFARFLTATRAERQGLLRTLLGLDVYTRVRELAKTRAAVATERAESAGRAREALELPDEDTMGATTQRMALLEGLSETVTAMEKRLTILERDAEKASARVDRLRDAQGRLSTVETPRQLEELDILIAEARVASSDAEEAHAVSVEHVRSLETALSELPTPETLEAWKKARSRRDELGAKLAGREVDEATRGVAEAERALADETARLDQTRASLAQARLGHAAHTLVSTLEPGQPCPVCDQVVVEVPVRTAPAELVELETAEAHLSDRVAGARASAESARTELARVETMRSEWEGQRELVNEELQDAPNEETVTEIESTVAGLAGEIFAARADTIEREAVLKQQRSRLEELADASRRVAKTLTTAQISVADLGPPVSESDDVVVQWKELMLWREETIGKVAKELRVAEEEVEGLADRVSAERSALVGLLEEAGVTAEEPYAVNVTSALHTTRAQLERFEQGRTESKRLGQIVEASKRESDVATALAGHLRASGFEQWLMAGVVADLVRGANDLLGQLSGGGYTLDSDDSGTFSIVDHRNADEIRSVATLSGGETFLVSLALALSLAETLAAKGGSGLDAIILDEGFGTLDDESLDTVADVLEELTGRGLMVGVITHVKELAARAPVRYEVRREPTGSEVRRVS